MEIILFSFIVSFLATTALTPIFIVILKKIGLMDDPKKHKHPGVIHSKPVPRGGGIPLILGIFITSIIFIPMTKALVVVFFAAFIALAVGIIDDKFDISPYFR